MTQLRPLDGLTAEQVRSWLDYNPDTGVFVWRHRSGVRKCDNSRRSGTHAGRIDSGGYRQINIDGRRVSAHRLAWLVSTGSWPDNPIDHINGCRDDNRLANLRVVPHAGNSQNMAKALGKTSALLGVSWNRRAQKWIARIQCNGESRFLGRFDSETAAGAAYREAKRKLHVFQPEMRGHHHG